MSRIKYYVDEHVSKAVIKGLKQRGVDVLSVPEAGMLEASDEEHLALAASEGRVLFSQDDDFLKLAAAGSRHAGIVYTKQHTSISDIVHGLMLIYSVLDAEEMMDHVEFL